MNQLLKENELSEASKQKIATLNDSSFFLTLVIIALFLSLKVLELQKESICNPSDEVTCELEIQDILTLVSAILTLVAVIYFYNLAKNTYCQPNLTDKAKLKSFLSLSASVFALVASITRLLNLFV